MKFISFVLLPYLYWCQSTGTQGEMTEVERLAKFQPNDFVLDIGINPKVISKGDGGSVALLAAATLPAVRTHKIAIAVISLEPCGVNRPHIHPRGTEAAYIVKGKNITMGFAPENGGKVVINNAGAGFASFFPQGYIHFQANNDCEPALLVAGLNHDDPGTITVVTQFFALPDGTLEAATGLADMEARRLKGQVDLGTAPSLMKECRKRCGLDKGPGPQPPNPNQPPPIPTPAKFANGDRQWYEEEMVHRYSLQGSGRSTRKMHVDYHY
ncbi:hypothetical protein HDV02_004177 [Globomyces sp. JEL0801]|nr:hypothetical protein HDV02_004177 [Globomyces sp. JEL0801]